MTQQERDEIRALVLSFSTKISDLPEVEALQDGDYVVVVQNDGSRKHSKKATLESLLELIKVYYPDHNGAKYQGVAHPSDTNVQLPVGTDGFWFAIDAGVYTNYGGITVTNAPKALFYNATTHEWSSEELWGDINGTVGFRLITGAAENSLDTFKIPVITGRDYVISALARPTGTFATLNIYEYDYNGTLINTTGYHVPEHSFVPRPGVDYIKISLGYNPSNPIDASLSEVCISSSIRNLVEGITNFVVDVLQGDYETRINSLENYVEGAIGNLTTNLGALTTRVRDAEGNITDLQVDALGIHADIRNAQGDILGLDVRADTLELDMTNAQGDILDLDVRASGISTRLENAEGDIDELSITAEGLEQRVTNTEGDVHTLRSTAETLESQITETDGRVSTLRQTVNEISASVESAEGDIAGLAIEAHRIDLYAQSINANLGDYEEFANNVMQGLQDQIDGVVDTYFYDYMPVEADATGAPDSQIPLLVIEIEGHEYPCEPYASWYAADEGGTAQEVNIERLKHLGDVFYDNKSGYAFRFSNIGTEQNPVFGWVEIQDSAVIKALADAARAQDTADHKRRVFVYSVTYPTPYAPYDIGDLWVKPVTVGTGASAQSASELYRCRTARARTTDVFPFNPAVDTDTTRDSCDWTTADDKGYVVNKTNLEILSNAIAGTSTQISYNEDGTIDSQSTGAMIVGAGNVRLQVANGAIDTAVGPDGKITTPLLGTGIDIINGDITLIANHISLKNQSDITGLELITIGESPNQKVVIDVGSLNVSGIFTTSAWDNSSLVNPGVKQQLLASAAGTAEQMLGTALYGNGGTQQQPTGGVYKALNPITTALTENTTVIAGGLMMSTALVLGGLTGPDDNQGNPTWEPWSGMFGVYDPTVGAGGGVAAWYGGTNVDAFTIPNWDTMTDAQKAAAWSQYRYARTLFRMDGSGYLANGEISWSDQGSLVIHGASIESTVLENSVTFGSTQITIQDIIELKSWFVKESYTDGQGNTRYAIKLATGTAAGTIAGFYTDGFISAGGLSSGGGASGTTIEAVWGTLTNDTPATPTTTTKIAADHIPIGNGLAIQGGLIVVTSQGTVTGIKIGSTTYTPASGSTTVDISAGIPTVPTVVSAFTNDAGYITSSDIPSSWAWSAITNTPTTLSGYGITDATIASGVITLGSSTITPVTDVAVGGSGHTNDLAITAGGSTSYITVPFATTASKLSTVSKTAWGQTYWTSGGVPDSISGNMSSVGNITMTGSISGATTISASTSVTSPIFYLNASTYFVLDSSGYVHLVTPSGKGFYCDGFISAGGISTGGGTSGIDLAAMWANLQVNASDTYGYNMLIHSGHYLPNVWASLQNNDNETGYHTKAIHTDHLPSITGVLTGTYTSQWNSDHSVLTTSLSLAAATGYYIPSTTDQSNWNAKADASALNYYLPLTAGSGKALTGDLYAPNLNLGVSSSTLTLNDIYIGHKIQASGGNFSVGFIDNGSWRYYLSVINNGVSTNIGLGGAPSSSYKVNVAGTLNAAALYENETALSSKYLALAGGTLSNPYYENQLTIHRSDGNDAVIKYENENGYLGSIGISNNGTAYFTNDHGASIKAIILNSNISSYAVTSVNGSGTGSITIDRVDYLKCPYDTTQSADNVSFSNQFNVTLFASVPGSSGGDGYVMSFDSAVQLYIDVDPTDKFQLRSKGSNGWNSWKTIYHSGNCNDRNTPWTCSIMTIGTSAQSNYSLYVNGTQYITGQIVSGYSSGAPFSVSSTTKVDYLNADLLDGKHDGELTARYIKYDCYSATITEADLHDGLAAYGILNGTTDTAITSVDPYGQVTYIGLPWINNSYGVRLIYGVNTGVLGYQTKGGGSWASSVYKFWHTGNANKYDVDWTCQNLYVKGGTDSTYQSSKASTITLQDYYLNHTIKVSGGDMHIGNTTDGQGAYISIINNNGAHIGLCGSFSLSYALYVNGSTYSNGNVVASGAITAGSASDISFKTNIKKITAESAKSLIMAMNPVTFTWNSLATSLYDKYVGDDLGLVAQEVEPYLPMAISPIFEKYKRLDYTKLIAPIIRVEQDHETRIQQLERESREKDAKIAELENTIARLTN